MPKPIAICLEALNAHNRSNRYLRCVAVPGHLPGLRLDKAGRVMWQREVASACELCVSADDRLILYRQEGMVPVRVERAGRGLDVPFGKPVVLADKDEIKIGRRRLRIHIHGQAQAVFAPSPLVDMPAPLTRLAQAAAVAALVGTVLTGTGCTLEISKSTPTIDVRDFPPVPMPITPIPTPTLSAAISPTNTPSAFSDEAISTLIQGEWVASQAYTEEGVQRWFNGKLTISGGTYTFQPGEQPRGTPVDGGLNFLFDHPGGEIEINYLLDGGPGQPFRTFFPEDQVAQVVFRSGSEESGPFWIQLQEGNRLIFTQGVISGTFWSIDKHLR